MKIIIDRFEDDDQAIVELEDKTVLNINRNLLPPKSKEGDVIRITFDTNETKKRKASIDELAKEIWND